MIHILTRRKSEKGTLFESLLLMVISKQGFGNLKSKIHAGGTEIDIEATSNVTKEKIRIEAKAHEKPIGTNELKKFLLTSNNDLAKKKINHAIFWSLSGINGTAKNYFEKELVKKFKDKITIKDNVDFQNLLSEIGLIGNDSSVDYNVKDLVKKKLLHRDLAYYQNQWYFIQYCSQIHKPTHFFVVNHFGKPVDDIIGKGIRDSHKELKKLNLILLSTSNQLQKILMYHESISIEEIIKEIKETRVDVESVIDELIDQQLIVKINSTYSLKKGLDTFLKIAKEFLENDDKQVLMKSPYLINSINDDHIISYIENRFYLKLTTENKTSIRRMVSVSASALHYSLFGSNIREENLVKQYGNNIIQRVYDENLRTILIEICLWILSDYTKGMVLGLQHTKAIDIGLKMRMVTQDELFFSVDSYYMIILATAGGTIKPGEAVVAKNPEMFLQTANALYNFGEKEKAIAEINRALSVFENKGDWLYTAYTNIGLMHHDLKQLPKAYSCYKKAIKLFPNKHELLLNLGLLLIDMKKIKNAKKVLNKALRLRPEETKIEYALARIKIIENEKDDCYELLEQVLVKEKRFVERINQDIEFIKIKKTKRYLNLLKKLGLFTP